MVALPAAYVQPRPPTHFGVSSGVCSLSSATATARTAAVASNLSESAARARGQGAHTRPCAACVAPPPLPPVRPAVLLGNPHTPALRAPQPNALP